jgi:phosphotransferase system HPr (HPr) family protein
MITKEQTIINKVGLHARPAALFVKAAQQFESEVVVEFKGQSVNAKSLLSVLGLGVTGGQVIKICTTGTDEQAAMDNLSALIDSGFGE